MNAARPDPISEIARWRDDPVFFTRGVLGLEADPLQENVLTALAPAGAKVACAAPRGARKSTLDASALLWHGVTRPGSRTILVAPVDSQTEPPWREAEALWRASCLPRLFPQARFLKDRIEFSPEDPNWYVAAHSAESRERIEGHHSRVSLLKIFDESQAIDDALFERCLGMGAPELRTLATGTGGLPTSWFGRAFSTESDHWTLALRVRADELPHLRERDLEMRKRLGENHPLYRTGFRSEFVLGAAGGFFRPENVLASVGRETVKPSEPVWLGVDSSRFGKDLSVAILRAGGKVYPPESWQGSDTQESAERIYRHWRIGAEEGTWHARAIAVDGVGVGSGVYDALRRKIAECRVGQFVSAIEYIAGSAAPDNARAVFGNLKTYAAQRAATAMECGTLSLPAGCPQLIEQLLSYGVAMDTAGRSRIVDPPGKSPDFGDAFIATFAAEVVGRTEITAGWVNF